LHGLINRSFQNFVSDVYGAERWNSIRMDAKVGIADFQSFQIYEDDITRRLIDGAATVLRRSIADVLDDFGTWLVSSDRNTMVRRLLRFSGADYVEFLHSLEDLADRTGLALPELDMPNIDLIDHLGGHFTLAIHFRMPGFGHVFLGLLRAVADDYGALATFHYVGRKDGMETLSIQLLDQSFSAAKDFSFGGGSQ
jgi:hypothetical protein